MTDRFDWKENSIDRGLHWICKLNGSVIGGISFSYIPSNNGGLFSRNHRSGSVSIVVRSNDAVLEKRYLSAKSRNEADKLVRKVIREEKLRSLVEATCAVLTS